MATFIIDGKTSRSLNVYATAAVEIPTSKKRIKIIEVPGREGNLTRDEGWDDKEIELSLAVYKENAYEHWCKNVIPVFHYAKKIVFPGIGPDLTHLIKSTEISPLQLETPSLGFFTAKFLCEPFAYYQYGVTNLVGANTQLMLVNPSTLEAKPKIVISGQGRCSIVVNGQYITFEDMHGDVVIDSQELRCYSQSPFGDQVSMPFYGQYPVFEPGENGIETLEGTTGARITARWRFV